MCLAHAPGSRAQPAPRGPRGAQRTRATNAFSCARKGCPDGAVAPSVARGRAQSRHEQHCGHNHTHTHFARARGSPRAYPPRTPQATLRAPPNRTARSATALTSSSAAWSKSACDGSQTHFPSPNAHARDGPRERYCTPTCRSETSEIPGVAQTSTWSHKSNLRRARLSHARYTTASDKFSMLRKYTFDRLFAPTLVPQVIRKSKIAPSRSGREPRTPQRDLKHPEPPPPRDLAGEHVPRARVSAASATAAGIDAGVPARAQGMRRKDKSQKAATQTRAREGAQPGTHAQAGTHADTRTPPNNATQARGLGMDAIDACGNEGQQPPPATHTIAHEAGDESPFGRMAQTAITPKNKRGQAPPTRRQVQRHERGNAPARPPRRPERAKGGRAERGRGPRRQKQKRPTITPGPKTTKESGAATPARTVPGEGSKCQPGQARAAMQRGCARRALAASDAAPRGRARATR